MDSDEIDVRSIADYTPIDTKDTSQLLSPRLDYVFKRIFGSDDSESGGEALRSLLSAVMEIPPDRLAGLQVRNSEIPGESERGKSIRLDLLVKLMDGTKINVEMQMHGPAIDLQARRILFYLCRLYAEGVPAGFDYEDLSPAVSIVFTDRTYHPDVSEAMHVYRMCRIKMEHGRVHALPLDAPLTDALEVRIVEMKKARVDPAIPSDDPLGMWLRFFEYGERKEVSSMLAQKDPALAQAVDRLREISQDERERIVAFEREKAILWDAMNRYHKKLQGKRIAEKARAEGLAEGKAEIVRRMLSLGLDPEFVAEATGLPMEEVSRFGAAEPKKSEAG